MSDETEYLGEPKRDPVEIVDADPAWAGEFEDLRSHLASVLGRTAIRIDHVGSTAVPGLASKPVIDVQVSVRDITDEESYRRQIESLDLPLRIRELEHRFFRPPNDQLRSVHVHVCQSGSKWERDHLLFVAYLRAHPEQVRTYEKRKRELAHTFATDRVRYTEAKSDFIDATLKAAEEWATRTGWSPE
jgi:GrpB-like predicted nucleotidyltransferase (UPF0157 family)